MQYAVSEEHGDADGVLLPKVNLGVGGLDCDMHLFNLRTLSDPAHPTAPSKRALMILHRQGRECALNDHGGCDVDGANVAPRFSGITVRKVSKCGLTGNDCSPKGVNAAKIVVEPMALEAFELTL